MDTGPEAVPDRPHDAMRLRRATSKRIVRACAWCGAAFETYANGRSGQFCSKNHYMKAYSRANRERIKERSRAWRAARRVARPVETACLRCGKPVPLRSTGRLRRYCSRSCRHMAWVARRRAQSQETPASATM
jgi:endogenous inhibitor of DNA gyrase (YacG/DUF329 family)